jgi:hypothetical protein
MTGGFSKESLEKYQILMSRQMDSTRDFTECVDVFDFRLCQRPSGTYYGTAGQCRKGVEVNRDDVIKEIKSLRTVTPKQAKSLSELSDEDLGRIHRAVKENASIDIDSAQRVSKAVSSLAGETTAGGKKEGGANLQDPEQAAKYADFYEAGKDKTHKAPQNASPEEVKAVLAELKDTLEPKDYRAVMSALGGKGSPTKEQLQAAGWKSTGERGEAVLKSLMDNEFKDVNGNFLSWRQGMQLDHRRAGAVGGSDRPDNWIWISTASNQTKGAIENVVKREMATGKLKPENADKRISELLVTKLRQNASMSAEAVAKAKQEGSAKAASNVQQAQALRDNLPLMPSQQRRELFNNASVAELKLMLKGSVNGEKTNPATGRKPSYRPVLSGGEGLRTRKDYGSGAQMKSLMNLRWGNELDSADIKNLGALLKASSGSTKAPKERLDELLGNFPPASAPSPSVLQSIIREAS